MCGRWQKLTEQQGKDIQLEVNDRLVDRLARSFVGNFNRLGLAGQVHARECVYEVLMSEWREQQSASESPWMY